MTTVDVINATGKKAGSVELPAEIFDVQTNIPLIHQVVVAQLAAARQGTASTKTRGEVAGGGRKPYRQKGTGRARQGSIRAPQYAGGGVAHGPVTRGYVQRTPKKMKAAALRGALSDRARDGRVHLVDTLVSEISTKAAARALARLTDRPRTLVVVDREDEITWMSLRNIPAVEIIAVDQLNTYDVVKSDDVFFTRAAYEALVGQTIELDQATDDQATDDQGTDDQGTDERAADDQLADNTDDDKAEKASKAPYGKGSHAPRKSGKAPKGYDIKGNADSMLYHTPDSQWYEQTVAEVWFDTTEAAEAAGFSAPGTGDKQTDAKEIST
jgi:large subunit ribosomal protein L4